MTQRRESKPSSPRIEWAIVATLALATICLPGCRGTITGHFVMAWPEEQPLPQPPPEHTP